MTDRRTDQVADIDLTKTNEPPAEDGTHDAPATLDGVSEADLAADVASPNRMDMDSEAPADAPSIDVDADGPANGVPDGPDGDRVEALEGQPNFLPGQVDPNGMN